MPLLPDADERASRRDGEAGVALIVLALSMVVLLVFAAFAVDLALKWNERRGAQASADVADLSGAQFLLGVGSTTAKTLAEAEVRRISAVNMATSAADWDTCVDTTRPAAFVEIALTTDCISWTRDFTTMRVRVPDVVFATTFGAAAGVDTLYTSAFAHVGVGGGGPRAVILPFGLPPSATGSEVCLKTGPSPFPAPPCDGPSEGNFGFLDFKRFTWPAGSNCSTNFVEENIAVGIDHALEVNTAVAGALHDFAGADPACPNVFAGPDRTEEQNGTTNNLHNGLVDGTGSLAGRLARGPYAKTDVMGHMLDDKPLWEFIDYDSSAHPAECDPGDIAGAAVPHDAMAACIDAFITGTHDPLFTIDSVEGVAGNDRYDLQLSPRWALVPAIHVDFGVPLGTGPYEFIEFVPVFLQTVYGSCSAVSCREFSPGEGNTIPTNGRAGAVTAFVLPVGSYPAAVLDDLFIEEGELDYSLTR